MQSRSAPPQSRHSAGKRKPASGRVICRALEVACVLLLSGVLAGCPGPGRQGKTPGESKGTSSAAQIPAATIAYIGNFRGFQRPCGCDQRQDGGLLRLATVLSVLRGEITAEAAMLDPSQLPPSHDMKIEATGNIPAAPDNSAAKNAESGTEPAGAAEDPAMPAGQEPPSPAVRVEPPAEAVLQPLWLIDCGNFSDQNNRLPGFRAATHLKALAQLGASAAVLGSAEAQLPPEQAKLAFGQSPLPLLSCNLTSKVPEIKVQPSLELGGGWYVIGLTEPEGATAGGFASGGMALRRKLGGHKDAAEAEAWATVSDPIAALRSEMEKLPSGAVVLVACAQLPEGLLDQISAMGPMLIIGKQRESDFKARVEAMALPALLDAPVRRGLLATFVSLKRPEPGAWEKAKALFWSYRLATGIRDELQMDKLLKDEEGNSMNVALSSDEWENNQWGQDEKFLPPDMRKKGSIVPGYVGSTICKDCHPAEHAVWGSTKHSHAYETLIKHDNGGTLDCLECHVVGLLEPGGFLPASAQPYLAAVGCESCHGPGGEHVGLAQQLDPAKLSPAAISAGKLPLMEKKAISRGSTADCLYCHDDFNSPDFSLEQYWPHVQH